MNRRSRISDSIGLRPCFASHQAAALAVRADLIGPEPDLSGLHEFTNVSNGFHAGLDLVWEIR
jgi:hypothetical protein